MEFNFLKRAHHYLQDGGIMVYIIPYDRFARDEISYFLAKNYEEIGLMRFGDENEEFEQFKQCVLLAVSVLRRMIHILTIDSLIFVRICQNWLLLKNM